MGVDDLLCAACSGRVVDGGCRVCRSSRESLPVAALPAEAFLLLATVLAIVLALVAR